MTALCLADVVLYLRGRAGTGSPISPVEALDLADVLERGRGRRPHLAVAEEIGCSLDTVRRRRQAYGPAMTADPDAWHLTYAHGSGRTPSRIGWAEIGHQAQQTIHEGSAHLAVELAGRPPHPVENSVGCLGATSLGAGRPATPSRAGQSGLRPSCIPVVAGAVPGGRGAPAAPPAPTEGSEEAPELGGPREGCGREAEGGREPGPAPTATPPAAPREAWAGGRRAQEPTTQQAGDDASRSRRPRARAARTATAAPVLAPPVERRDDPERWEAGSPPRREAEAVARRLLREARLAGVLRIERAYATVAQAADSIRILHRELGGWDAAVRAVRVAILRTVRQRETEQEGAPRPDFAGRAQEWARRPRRAARSPWWTRGIDQGWDAPGWVPVPAWGEVPGWSPSSDPALLPLGPDDPDLETLRARRRRGRRRADRLTETEQRHRAVLEASGERWGLGDRALRAVLTNRPCPWVRAVLDDHGVDHLGTIRRWQLASRGGSDSATEALIRLDRLAGRDGGRAPALRTIGPLGAAELYPESLPAERPPDRAAAAARLAALRPGS